MARMKKKGTTGAAANYISRTRAVKKLQISLADFRRLCILKGIYPRDPNNRKKAGGGSTAPRTYYYTKDVQHLLHEPVLAHFRQNKIFLRKLNRAVSKGQTSAADSLRANHKPEMSLDHIVRERYPSFAAALRDLDDCLALVYLFAALPPTKYINHQRIRDCQRLVAEWENYVIQSKALSKTFLSIKGIYYQVEIKGEKITWCVPWKFTIEPPTDVDFRVLGTFLQFYTTLQTFVNYKLYASSNLLYPPQLSLSADTSPSSTDQKPQISESTEDSAQILAALTTATTESIAAEKEDSKAFKKRIKLSAKRIKDLDLSAIASAGPANATPDTTETSRDTQEDSPQDMIIDEYLFSKCVFYLSREVPRDSLEFVIRASGGQLGWDAVLGADSPLSESDPRITHHLIDRPALTPVQKTYEGKREFVQPQWIYDCVNTRALLKIRGLGAVQADGENMELGYGVNCTLPAHLSPFVEYKDGMYKPDEARIADGETLDDMEGDILDDDEEEVDMEGAESEDEEMDDEEEDDEDLFDDEDQENTTAKKQKKVKVTQEVPKDPQLQLQLMMMSKKDRKLYKRIQTTNRRKADDADKLKAKKMKLTGKKVTVNSA